MPTLLAQHAFEGEVSTVNLVNHDPGWEYAGDPDRYEVWAGGFAFAGIGEAPSGSIASHDDDDMPVATGIRLLADVRRGDVDFVGGGIEFVAYYRTAARGTTDTTDRLQLLIRRTSVSGIQMVATYYKATGGVPATVVLTSFSIVHLPGETWRYIWEVDETTLTVRQYRADPVTGTNEVALSEGGPLPAELVAHGAGDRFIGWGSQNAGSGLTSFRLYHLEVYDLASVPAPSIPTGPPCTTLLQVFEDDGQTVAWEAASDLDHSSPFLTEPEQYEGQSLDMAQGSMSLGTVRIGVVDKAQIVGDQDSGFVTGKLAELGLAAIGGRRNRYLRFIDHPTVTYQVIMDGPASQPRLAADYASFDWEIRDTRETERKVRLFDLISTSEAATVISGATPTIPTVPGTGYDFDWDVVTNP